MKENNTVSRKDNTSRGGRGGGRYDTRGGGGLEGVCEN